MANYTYRSNRRPKNKSTARIFLFLILLVIIATLGIFSFIQYVKVKSLQSDLELLIESQDRIETENQQMRQRYDEIIEENEKLREENHMFRSSKVINQGNRDTNKVAITIDDGYGNSLILQALEHLRDHDVNATFFTLGVCIENEPGVWRQAVEEGHELGNHTYSHRNLTTMSDEEVKNELNRWQENVNNALGYNYHTYFFRPPDMDGFFSSQANRTGHYKEIIADQGMFAVLWDVDHFHGLGNIKASPSVIADYVLNNARGGSIILMHFNDNDIAALPAILSGLRNRGLEPCSLSELLLVDFQI